MHMSQAERERLGEKAYVVSERARAALESMVPVVWKAIRRDVIAAVALGGALADSDLKVEISGPSLLNADSYALVATSAADALIAKLDEPKASESPEGGG